MTLGGCPHNGAHDVVCGDGVREGDEQCDGEDLGDANCAFLGFSGDGLTCKESCRWDVRTCRGCGNTVVDSGEACDGTNLDGQSCTSLGFEGGMLACDPDCGLILEYCHGGCGNGMLEGAEACDGTDLGGRTCGGEGYLDGTLACGPDCTPDPTDCGPALGPVGAACTADGSCLSGSCLTEPAQGLPGGSCTADCHLVGQSNICLEPEAICGCVDPDCVYRSCLRSCTPGGPNVCREGYDCVDQADGVGACMPRCADHSQCVVTHTCDTTAGSPTQGYCRVPPELCGNGLDDDLDGRTDCADHDCNAGCPSGELCDNGSDDEGDGLVDCDDGECVHHVHCTGIQCTPSGPLPTDATVLAQSNDQTGSASAIDDWCGSGFQQWTGPEQVYSLTVTDNTFVTVSLVGVTADVDLLVLTDGQPWGVCNPRACLARSTAAGLTDEQVTFEARAGATYWVVVDGWQGAVATYDLVVSTVAGERCGNSTDDDGDGLVDCADPSCFGQVGCTTEQTCADGQDNDQDGIVDCADSDCSATPWCLATPVLTEDFTTWPPPGWTIQDGGPDGYTWQRCTVCAESLATAAGSYAVVSSDLAGPSWPLDEGLVTPAMDLTGHSTVWLNFTHHFENRPPANVSDFAMVEVSLDSTNWTPITFWGTTTPARTELLNLSGVLANQPEAYIRFRYVDGGTWAWYWAIDSVTVSGN